MRRSVLAVAMALAVTPLAAAEQQRGNDNPEKEVTIQGCVIPGERGTYALTGVTEVPGPGGSVMPDVAHGRRILFWLRNDDNVKKHIGRKIEVRGEFSGLEESEIELKAGRQDRGGMVVEFEGPGRDVRVPNAAVGDAVGTAGRTVPEKDDIKTYLAYVDVTQVRVITGACQ